MQGKPYVTVTSNGARFWVADDRDHALEQHEDAFGDDPSEKVIYCCDVELGEAAPDLLAAGKKVAMHVRLGDLHPKDLQNLRAAIAKAEGGSR